MGRLGAPPDRLGDYVRDLEAMYEQHGYADAALPARPSRPGTRGDVLLWPDTFTNSMHPHVGRAAVAVLEDAGWRMRVPGERCAAG